MTESSVDYDLSEEPSRVPLINWKDPAQVREYHRVKIAEWRANNHEKITAQREKARGSEAARKKKWRENNRDRDRADSRLRGKRRCALAHIGESLVGYMVLVEGDEFGSRDSNVTHDLLISEWAALREQVEEYVKEYKEKT